MSITFMFITVLGLVVFEVVSSIDKNVKTLKIQQ